MDMMFGRYELGQRLGSGAMGVVYKAHDPEMGRDVALKMLHGGQYATTLALRLFQEEIRVFARLDHPYIVPIYEAGEHAGQLYFTMKLMPSDLKAQLQRFAGDPAGAAALVEKIALAAHHFHQRSILHRDLKPANILLDAEDPPNPYVADFGVAKQLDEDGQFRRTSLIVGTPGYAAPEQAAGKLLTWTTDVYSMGVILYELLVQRLPFDGSTHDIEEARQSPAKDPHVLDRRIDRDLASICLRCLEKEPEHRYPTAELLAIALRRYLNGEPYEGASRARRVWRWCLVHSALTGLFVSLLLGLVLAVVVVGEQQVTKMAEVREANRRSAVLAADSVLAQFRSLGDAVARAAADPLLVDALGDATPANERERQLQAFCQAKYAYFNDPRHHLNVHGRSPFHLWFVLDGQGALRAQHSGTSGTTALEGSFAWRDYFRGARALAGPGTHISRAFKSESDARHKFAFSSPVRGAQGELLGVVVAGIESNAYLGPLEPNETQSTIVLVAPRDRERYAEEPPFPYLILRHPAFRGNSGDAVGMSSEVVRQVVESGPHRDAGAVDQLWPASPERAVLVDGYLDPVAQTYPEYAGRWSAGVAPVGDTGFVVIVQSEEEGVLGPELALTRRLVIGTLIAGLPGLLFALSVPAYKWWRRRRGRRTKASP